MNIACTDEKSQFLKEHIQHIDITSFNAVPLIDSYREMAFQSRNLANAADIYTDMLEDSSCSVILCLAGSLVSAGLKKVITDMIRNNMVDAIVSTGAIIVDQDFFEALGFHHYKGKPTVDDEQLRQIMVDRIYDTFIDEEDLRICDDTIRKIADSIEPGVYSSREFIAEMGRYLEMEHPEADSIVLEAYRHQLPIFCPAFSDSSAGFGLVYHQNQYPDKHVAIDSVKDFRELTTIKTSVPQTGLVMIGGGVPKNFVQDTVVAADILGIDVSMHKYAIQLTVADERDGALSGSTLKEANSWGKVDATSEQMVYAEATLTFPLLVSNAYHKGSWKGRETQRLNKLFGY